MRCENGFNRQLSGPRAGRQCLKDQITQLKRPDTVGPRELSSQTTQPAEGSVWGSLPDASRRLVTATLVFAFVQLLLVDVYFRLQELPQINQYLAGQPLNFVEDGIQYSPMVVSGLVCAVLIAAVVIYVNLKSRGSSTSGLYWLGGAWLIVSVALVLDLLIDTFEIKWPIIALFAYVGIRYWKGVRRNSLGLVLAPAVAVIGALDGLNHSSGQDCVTSGLDACSGKAVSDIYLVILLLILVYLTIQPYLGQSNSKAATESS